MIDRLLLTAHCLLFGWVATAQTLPVLNQNPTSLHWYKLNTPHFRVLYPKGFETTAQRTANRLENLYEPIRNSSGRSGCWRKK